MSRPSRRPGHARPIKKQRHESKQMMTKKNQSRVFKSKDSRALPKELSFNLQGLETPTEETTTGLQIEVFTASEKHWIDIDSDELGVKVDFPIRERNDPSHTLHLKNVPKSWSVMQFMKKLFDLTGKWLVLSEAGFYVKRDWEEETIEVLERDSGTTLHAVIIDKVVLVEHVKYSLNTQNQLQKSRPDERVPDDNRWLCTLNSVSYFEPFFGNLKGEYHIEFGTRHNEVLFHDSFDFLSNRNVSSSWASDQKLSLSPNTIRGLHMMAIRDFIASYPDACCATTAHLLRTCGQLEAMLTTTIPRDMVLPALNTIPKLMIPLDTLRKCKEGFLLAPFLVKLGSYLEIIAYAEGEILKGNSTQGKEVIAWAETYLQKKYFKNKKLPYATPRQVAILMENKFRENMGTDDMDEDTAKGLSAMIGQFSGKCMVCHKHKPAKHLNLSRRVLS